MKHLVARFCQWFGGVLGREPWYRLRCLFWTRYHIIDVRDETYEYGWLDADEKILRACFTLLCDFVEKEDGLAILRRKNDFDSLALPAFFEPYEEAKELYEWWQACGVKATSHKEQTEMLHRLIAIRGALWT